MGREEESKKAEQELQKLRKLPENRVCANCRAPGAPLLTAVVVPFRTFVCSSCKSAHQSFSHRCKSTQMSLWTMEEVRMLEERSGGGNRAAQERWLRHVKDSERPREGDRDERIKEFVRRAYIEECWAGGRAGSRNDAPRRGRGDRQDSPEDTWRGDERRRGGNGGGRSEAFPEPRAAGRAVEQGPPRAAEHLRMAPPPSGGGRSGQTAGNMASGGDLFFDPDAPLQAPPLKVDGAPLLQLDAPLPPTVAPAAAAAVLDSGFNPNKTAVGGGGDFFDPNAVPAAGAAAGGPWAFDPFAIGQPQPQAAPAGGPPAFDPFVAGPQLPQAPAGSNVATPGSGSGAGACGVAFDPFDPFAGRSPAAGPVLAQAAAVPAGGPSLNAAQAPGAPAAWHSAPMGQGQWAPSAVGPLGAPAVSPGGVPQGWMPPPLGAPSAGAPGCYSAAAVAAGSAPWPQGGTAMPAALVPAQGGFQQPAAPQACFQQAMVGGWGFQGAQWQGQASALGPWAAAGVAQQPQPMQQKALPAGVEGLQQNLQQLYSAS